MVTYGVTAEGFIRKPQAVILEEINGEQQAALGAEWDVSAESVAGQLNGIASRRESLLWEMLEILAGGNDPDKAEDFLLTAIAKLTGTEREAADYSTVELDFTLTIGAQLLSGTHFVEHETDATIRVTPVEDFTAPSTGSHTVTFRAENLGEVTAAAHTLTVISTPVVGWGSPDNDDDLEGGRVLAEDPELRIDREAQIASAGGSTLDGVAAAVRKVPGVITVLPFENVGPGIDANGLPPQSLEMVVWDGDTEEADDDAIAQAIWNKKGGCRSYGFESGTAIDANGDEHVINFSRAAPVLIYVEYDIDGEADFDDAVFKLAAQTRADEVFTGGKSVLATRMISIAWEQDNIDNVLAVRLGLATNPTLSADIPISVREIARFSTTRIDVTVT